MAVLAGPEPPASVNSLNNRSFSSGTVVASNLRRRVPARQAGVEGGHGYLRRNDDGRVRPAGAALRAREHLRQHRELADDRLQAHRHEIAGSVTAFSRLTNTIQGDLQSTGIPTNMALNGEGYFIVQERSGTANNRPIFGGGDLYTRRGDFAL